MVADARRALNWYVSALGAARRGEVITMDDGRIGHAELELRGSVVYLADESPQGPVAAPRPGAPATVSLTFEVPDVDASVATALAQGAVLERPPADNPYGRNAVIRDPFGHRWIISAVIRTGRRGGGPLLRRGDRPGPAGRSRLRVTVGTGRRPGGGVLLPGPRVVLPAPAPRDRPIRWPTGRSTTA